MFLSTLTTSGLSPPSAVASSLVPAKGRHFIVTHEDGNALIVPFDAVSILRDLAQAWRRATGAAVKIKGLDANMTFDFYVVAPAPVDVLIEVTVEDRTCNDCCIPLCGDPARNFSFSCGHGLCNTCYGGIMRVRFDTPGNENRLGATCPVCRAERSAQRCPIPDGSDPAHPFPVEDCNDEVDYGEGEEEAFPIVIDAEVVTVE